MELGHLGRPGTQSCVPHVAHRDAKSWDCMELFTVPVPVPFSCWAFCHRLLLGILLRKEGEIICFELIIGVAEECVSSRGLCGWPGAGQHSGEDGAWHQVGATPCLGHLVLAVGHLHSPFCGSKSPQSWGFVSWWVLGYA